MRRGLNGYSVNLEIYRLVLSKMLILLHSFKESKMLIEVDCMFVLLEVSVSMYTWAFASILFCCKKIPQCRHCTKLRKKQTEIVVIIKMSYMCRRDNAKCSSISSFVFTHYIMSYLKESFEKFSYFLSTYFIVCRWSLI